MNEGAIALRGIRVVRAYADTPASALDRPRLLQILVNIIANAVEAMDSTPQERRELMLGIVAVPSDDAEPAGRLHLTVRDQGEGIERENLTHIFSHGFTTRSTSCCCRCKAQAESSSQANEVRRERWCAWLMRSSRRMQARSSWGWSASSAAVCRWRSGSPS